jgi:hypothetical protein
VPQATRRARESGVNDEMALRTASYRPRNVESTNWSAIQPFVLDCAVRLPLNGWSSTTRVLRVLTQLAAWAAGEGLPLDPEVVLDPDSVERFIEVGANDDRSRATYRSVLRRVGPLLTERAPWEPKPMAVARRQVALPYSARELDQLRLDVGRQATQARLRAARALVALGLGAGLDGRWVTRVGARDVARRSGVVVVRVGEPSPRAVPVLGSWENEILELAGTAGGEFLVGGHSTSRNRASALAASLVIPPGHPRLSASRLRSTWLLWHLNAGTRLPELAAAAGLKGVTVLSDLLSLVDPMPEGDAGLMLREASR